VHGAIFDRAEILSWHHTAMDLLIEAEPRATFAGPHLHDHIAELAVAARLLLVLAALCRGAPDRLAIGGLRTARGNADPELALEPVERHAQVHFALPRQPELPRHRIGAKRERAVFIDQPGH